MTLSLPEVVRHGARSLRLLWGAGGVTLIHGSSDANRSLTGTASYSHRLVHGDATLVRGRSGVRLPYDERVATAGVRTSVHVAACLSSAVHGAVLYPAESFAGRPAVLWRGATNGSTPGRHACACMPWLPHSLRVVGKADALMIGGDGVVEVARASSAGIPICKRDGRSTAEDGRAGGGGGSGCSAGGGQDATAAVLAVCGGTVLQAVELFSQPGWQGRSAMLKPRMLCSQRVPAALLRLDGAASFRLHRRADTASLYSPPNPAATAESNGSCTILSAATAVLPAKQRVLSADMASLALAWHVVSVRLGRSVTAISLFSMANYAGERLLLSHASRAACPIGGGDVLVAVPAAWQRAVGSVVVHRDCSSHGLLCPSLSSTAEGDEAAATGAARVMETEVPSFGEVLAFRARGALAGVPASLREKHGFFHAYNPTLLAARGGGSVQVVCRLSNYHFCTKRKRFDENVHDARGALMSLVAHAELNLSSWEVQHKDASADRSASTEHGGSWRLWGEVNALSSITANELVSGLEDPRALQLDDGSVLVLVATWETTGIQWQHIIDIPAWRGGNDGGGSGGSSGVQGSSGGSSMRNALARDDIVAMRLGVELRYVQMLRGWLPQFWQQAQLREKNWSPFTFDGDVYLEYSLQPRLVLLLNRRTGACTPVLPLSSSRGVQAWLDQLGPVSGGPPSVYLAGHGVYLGLAHVKLWKKKGRGTATSAMIYKHVW